MPPLIGTSGWQYGDWRGVLYPGLVRRDRLTEYGRRFATVENNNAFYRLPSRETFAARLRCFPRAVLERHDAALCLADRGSRPVTPLWRTADWGYPRFHGGPARHRPLPLRNIFVTVGS